MIKKARLKILFLSMVAMIFVTATLLFTINMVDYLQNDRELTVALEDLLAQQRSQNILGPATPPPENKPGAPGKAEGDAGSPHERESAVAQYRGRFAMVTVQGSTVLSMVSGQPNLNEEVLDESFVLSILEEDKESGYASGYKYLVQQDGNTTYIGFLDCTVDLAGRRTLLLISVAVALLSLALSFLFLYFLSAKAVWPLKESVAKQKRFITDAGHELKTPLQALSANLDILEMDLPDNEWIEGSRNQIGKMSKLIQDLIALSRLEENDAALPLCKISASQVASDAIEPYHAIAETSGKTLQVTIQDHLFVFGNKEKLTQLFSILCDNAVKYAPADGTIQIRLHAAGSHVLFETENPLPAGQPQPDLAQVFERFYRADGARSRDDLHTGYGLGLSIAKAIADRHGCTLSASHNEEGHMVFTVSCKAL